jgi:hypothetical protein
MTDALRLFTEAVSAQLADVPESARGELIARVVQLAQDYVLNERRRCVDLCLRRGALWRETSRTDSPLAREARARANEALYLADLLETGEELPEIS